MHNVCVHLFVYVYSFYDFITVGFAYLLRLMLSAVNYKHHLRQCEQSWDFNRHKFSRVRVVVIQYREKIYVG